MSLRVALPWPAVPLWPNRKAHWRTKAEAVKKAKSDAMFLTLEALHILRGLHGENKLSVAIKFQPPTRRRYDLDNALAALKGPLDGIAYALGVDDSRFQLALERGEPVKGGCVMVTITVQ